MGEVLSPSLLTFSSSVKLTITRSYGVGTCQAGLLDEVSARGYRTSGGPADTGESSAVKMFDSPQQLKR